MSASRKGWRCGPSAAAGATGGACSTGGAGTTGGAGPTGGAGACASCMRRGWLLAALSGPLEFCARDRGRLLELLRLGDAELMEAVAGRRSAELKERYRQFQASELPREDGVEAICRHRRRYPDGLRSAAAPPMLNVAGTAERLASLAAAPVVAIVGSNTASDYGMETAHGLARGLAASGVTVAASFTDGIAIAAHAGALEVGAGSIAVTGGGLGVSCPARRRALYARVTQRGCAVSELPLDHRGRRWGQLASERIVVALAQLVVLVEAAETPADLAAARIALALGRSLAAVPGRVSSPLSRGTHALLMDGANLVRGPQDVLELLHMGDTRASDRGAAAPARATFGTNSGLEPRLMRTLERVGSGCDTPDKLTRAGAQPSDVLLALSELELMGLLARGDGGRYLPRHPLPA
jgi:DNA processing protein